MKITISKHARLRMKERDISREQVYLTILTPDKVDNDKTNFRRRLAKKIYRFNNSKGYLLLVIYEFNVSREELSVITVISTTKINKYL